MELLIKFKIGLIHNSNIRPHPNDKGWQAHAAYSFNEAVNGVTPQEAICLAILALYDKG